MNISNDIKDWPFAKETIRQISENKKAEFWIVYDDWDPPIGIFRGFLIDPFGKHYKIESKLQMSLFKLFIEEYNLTLGHHFPRNKLRLAEFLLDNVFEEDDELENYKSIQLDKSRVF